MTIATGNFYKSKKWIRKRERVLRRDGYRCQYAKRYGKTESADTVHHIWPLEDYPEYALCSWNLISMSNASHNKMHVRKTKELTREGETLRSKTPPR